MYRDIESPPNINIRQVVVLLVVAFTVALGVVIGTRLSSDAIAVLVGVIAGVAASLPTALLLLVVTRRRQDYEPEPYEEPNRASAAAPPIIVVTPGNMPQVLPQYGAGMPGTQQLPAHSPRRFRVMGLDDDELEPLEGQSQPTSWYQE
jgi:hypothetical protein